MLRDVPDELHDLWDGDWVIDIFSDFTMLRRSMDDSFWPWM
jgi:hypothetical protein